MLTPRLLTSTDHRDPGTDHPTGGGQHAPPRRRWPLLAIGASAGTATWSGWVGLGERVGFGLVKPLPGIWDGLTINTAVTLPIGVECYAIYALSVATSSVPLQRRTRRYAWASAAAALVLGMAGQVAYHVLTAHHPSPPSTAVGGPVELAPAWLIAAVSCLPVLVLGAASLLWHLAGTHPEPGPGSDDMAPTSYREPATGRAADRFAIQTRQAVRDTDPTGFANPVLVPGPDGPRTVHLDSAPTAPPTPVSGPGPGPTPDLAEPIPVRTGDLARARAAVAAGHLPPTPTAKAIRLHLGISSAHARATRDALTAQAAPQAAPGGPEPAPPHPSPAPAVQDAPSAPDVTPHTTPEISAAAPAATHEEAHFQTPTHLPQESTPGMHDLTAREPLRKAPEIHTYATPLP